MLGVVATISVGACAETQDAAVPASDGDAHATPDSLATLPDPGPDTLRVALFNIRELSIEKLEEGADAGVGTNAQLRAAAQIIRRIRPDVLILNEIDHAVDDDLAATARAFARLYLGGDDPLEFEHAYAAPNNTGTASGIDLNGDGVIATAADLGTREYGDDAFGFGTYPGQYSMAVLSVFPFDEGGARTFQRFRWKDLPGHHMPSGYYSTAAEESLRLSSKSHWDLPVQLPSGVLRLFLSHPTPPVFDGDEDRNGRRNFDEIGFWAAYLDDSPYLYDDRGLTGGYGSAAPFLIAGDLNARPDATDAIYDGIPSVMQLLDHPRVQDTGPTLTSRGGAGERDAGPPLFHERSTAVFGGGWRIDYLLPSTTVTVLDGGVFWPTEAEDAEGAAWAEEASDHRLLWLEVAVP